MREIVFTYNWNNKLNCKAFTSIRISDYYTVGYQYKVTLKSGKESTELGTAIVVSVREFWLDQLNEFISYLDTGYDVDQCREVILRMHPEVNFEKKKLRLILFKYISKN